jgi:choline-sulfatase
LLAEAQRAELREGGLFIDAGAPDLNKYTLGGWRTGWGIGHAAPNGPSYVSVDEKAVALHVVTREVVQEVVFRARSPHTGQVVSILVDGESAGQAEVGADWSVQRVSLKATGGMAIGSHEIGFVFARGRGSKSRAEMDWILLARAAGCKVPPDATRVASISLGHRTQRALVASPARTYSYHLQVPNNAYLLVDYGADGAEHFAVRATADGSKPSSLLDVDVVPNQWREAKIDLKALAGKAIRLDLVSSGNAQHAGWGEPELMTPDAPRSALVGGPHKLARNAIFVMIDTARADEYSPWRHGSPVKTPAYDALAREGTIFHTAYANENWTKPSVATLLSGLYPSTHGAQHDPDVLSDEVKLLPEYLKDAGFVTAAFIANGFISDKFGFKRGWDTYTNYIRESKVSDAEKVYGDALAWLKERPKNKRFLLYLQTIDPHVPYQVPEEYVRKFHPEPYKGVIGPTLDGYEQADISKGKKKVGPDDIAWIKALYHAEVAYHEDYMGRFFDELRKSKLLDDTLVVVTNDHGEELGERGRYGHGHSLYEELLRAPLLMRYPAVFEAGTTVDTITELVDVMPTVLDVLGVKVAAELDGTSLLPVADGNPAHRPAYALSEFLDGYRSVRVGRWKLITSSAWNAKMFDIESDRGENRDRAGDAPIARRLCETLLGEALATPAKARRYQGIGARRRFKPGKVQNDRELERQLKGLGYLGG